jgi:hypothetical protein
MSDSPDSTRRTAERVPIHGELRGDIMVFEPLLVREVSATGASIETSFPMHINSLHDVRLTLDDVSVVLKGRIAHSRVSDINQDVVTYRTGVEFIEPSDAAVKVLTDFLKGLKASPTGASQPQRLRMHVGRLPDATAR